MNEASQEPFLKAQADVLGQEHSYPMIAYGTNKKAAAWKLYAKAQGVPFEIANKVSEQIKRYEFALKHADEEEKEKIDVLDYIDAQFHDIWKGAQAYLGTITSWSIAPCSSLLYQGDIRKEIGLAKVKDNICCIMDGHWAEEGHFLKNDNLVVSVLSLINRAYAEAKVKVPTVNELLKLCTPDDPCWDVYKKGATMGINQVEQDGSRNMCMQYSPKNISELTAFVAAVRPGFASMRKQFIDRKHFSLKFRPIDKLIQTKEMPESYIFYQEQVMAILNYAGFPMSDCYTAIKNIAKKRAEKVMALKGQFLEGLVAKAQEDGLTEEAAKEKAIMLWQVVEDNSSYSFNSSHSYCVALDSLYGAWIKAHYPLAFYKAYLEVQDAKGDKDKMKAAKEEAETYFDIHFPPFRFGQDNREQKANLETNTITNALSAIKGYSKTMAKLCWECSKEHFDYFVDVLAWFDKHSVGTAKLSSLIKIDYFEQYGNIPTLMQICDIFDVFHQGNAKQIKKENLSPRLLDLFAPYLETKNAKGVELKTVRVTNGMGIMRRYEDFVKEQNIPDVGYKVKMQNQLDILGYVDLTTGKPEDRRKLLVTDCSPQKSKESNTIWAYRIGTRSVGTGKTARLTVRESTFTKEPLSPGDIIIAKDLFKNSAGYWYLTSYEHLF